MYLKHDLRLMKNFMQKVYKTGILNHTANKYWENKAFLTCVILHFIFVKTVSIVRK